MTQKIQHEYTSRKYKTKNISQKDSTEIQHVQHDLQEKNQKQQQLQQKNRENIY